MSRTTPVLPWEAGSSLSFGFIAGNGAGSHVLWRYFVEQLICETCLFVQFGNPGISPEKITTGLRSKDHLVRLLHLQLGRRVRAAAESLAGMSG